MRLGFRAALALCLCTALCSASESRKTPLVRAVARAQASVVNIHTEKTSQDRDGSFPGGQPRKVNGMGTGIIIDERGYIVTNQHVIADVDNLRVSMQDGSTYQGQIISYNRKHDLAIIKISATKPLQVAPIGTSSDLMLGETVFAIGNAFGYEHTITVGVVSALGRDVEVNEKQGYKNLIQTDTSINPGNSGGPLVNLDGEVVGINVAIRAGAQRIGFAIPIDDARVLIAGLLNTRRLNDTYHGIVARDIKSAEDRRLVVASVEPHSPAAAAGVKAGDVIVHSGSLSVVDQADLERSILSSRAGDKIEVKVRRDGNEVPLALQLARNPGPVAATAPVEIPRHAPAADDVTWQILGLRLAKMPETQVASLQTRFRGGMRVLEVQPDSPAARQGIKQGDLLVGLHTWETISHENVSYVLSHPQLTTFNPLQFYVLRGKEELVGRLQLASPEGRIATAKE
jgi:serine protease Do